MGCSTVVITLVLCVSLCNGQPNEEVNMSSSSSSSQSSSSANGYAVTLSQIVENGQCVATMKISGNGIDKIVKYNCDNQPQNIININSTIWAGDYFSDSPGRLVHLTGDKCEKEVFQDDGGRYTSKVEPMDEKECKEVKDKIENLKEENKKWNEWVMKQQEETEKQMQQLQNNLQELFGGLPGMIFGK